MELKEGLWLVDLALYLPRSGSLIIADLHLGYEEALAQEGILVPRGHLQGLLERLEGVLTQVDGARRLVINGDLRHQFGPLSFEEWQEARELLSFLSERLEEIVLIEGNHDHDLGLGALAAKFPKAKTKVKVKVQRSLREGEFLIIHGDRHPREEELAGTSALIIGHEHPAVGLRNEVTGRIEVYKAFLVGTYRGRELFVQPSFNLLIKGSDITYEEVISPLIDSSKLGELEVWLISDEGQIYHFGKLEELLRPHPQARLP